MSLFDDDDDDMFMPASAVPKAAVANVTGGGQMSVFLDLVARIPGLRLVPCRGKIPIEAGWTGTEYWLDRKDAAQAIRRAAAEHGTPNFAFALGPGCGPNGDMAIEPDNQAGEDWCRTHLPATEIRTLTRHGFWHRHYGLPRPGTDGFSFGNMTDFLGSRHRHRQEAIHAGFQVLVDRRRREDPEHQAHVASQRQLALAQIEMGPIVDLKAAGGQIMVPGSRHETGYVYQEDPRWTLEAWNARPVFDMSWLPASVWAERARALAESQSQAEAADIDGWWTSARRYAAAERYVRKVPAMSTGENSSGTFMRLATVLVRGFALDVPQCRQLAALWAQEICAHEPWSRKEIEHKLRQAQDKGRMAFGAMLGDRMLRADARQDAAEEAINRMMAGYASGTGQPVVRDYVDLDEDVELPVDFVDSASQDTVPEVLEPVAEVIDIGEKRRERRELQAVGNVVTVTNGLPVDDDDDGWVDGGGSATLADDIQELDVGATVTKITPTTPTQAGVAAGSSAAQIRMVLSNYSIDYEDLRANGENFHPIRDKENNVRGMDITTKNMSLMFKYSKKFKGKFAYNKITEEQEFNGKPVTDLLEQQLKDIMDTYFDREVPKDRVRGGIDLAAAANSYNPVQDFFARLPAWDRIPRWDLVASEVLKVTSDLEHAKVLVTRWGLSAAARALSHGCKADSMLVLQSRTQGLGKSTFGKILFGKDFFTDQPLNIDDKDSRMLMARYWCIEIGEGDIMTTPTKIKAFKAFLSQSSDDIRLPYARRTQRTDRRCVFLATTNEDQVLLDKTGGRRFSIIRVGGKIDLAMLHSMRDQLWAEAKYKVNKVLDEERAAAAENRLPVIDVSCQWWLTDEENEANNEVNRTNEREHPWEQPIATFLEKWRDSFFRLGDAFDALDIEPAHRDNKATNSLLEVLLGLGCVKHAGGKKVRIPGCSQQARWWIRPGAKVPEET